MLKISQSKKIQFVHELSSKKLGLFLGFLRIPKVSSWMIWEVTGTIRYGRKGGGNHKSVSHDVLPHRSYAESDEHNRKNEPDLLVIFHIFCSKTNLVILSQKIPVLKTSWLLS